MPTLFTWVRKADIELRVERQPWLGYLRNREWRIKLRSMASAPRDICIEDGIELGMGCCGESCCYRVNVGHKEQFRGYINSYNRGIIIRAIQRKRRP